MTEAEKKAEEYCKNSKDFVKYTSETYRNRLKKAYRDGYIKGFKEGRPKWHDLRKNPNDLPKEKGEYRVYIYDSGIKKNRTVNLDFLGCSWVALIDVIAWCELPKFEE